MQEYIFKHRFFFLSATFVLFLSFSVNFFSTISMDKFLLDFNDSEALVVNQVVCKGDYFDSQLLVKKEPGVKTDLVCMPDTLKPYSSQYGLQGRIYTIGYKAVTSVKDISPRVYISLAQLMTAFLSAALLAVLVLWVRQNFGLITASVTLALTALSPMLVGFAGNLYWALPLMLAPLVLTICAYNPNQKGKRRVLFWLALGLLLYMRFLCGYEFLTTITIMVVAAAAYHLKLANKALNVYAKETLIIFAIAIFSFMAALGTHVIALQGSTGSISAAINIVKDRAVNRTSDTRQYLEAPYVALRTNFPEVYAVANQYLSLDAKSQGHSEKWALLVAAINYAILPVARIPITIGQPLSTHLESTTAFIILLASLYHFRRRWAVRRHLRQIDALIVGASVGLAGYISWLVLAKSHALVHAHINGILVYLPFALFGYAVIGLYVQFLVHKVVKR